LGIDTIRDRKDKAFVKHEIQFYEGIASALSDTLTFIDFDNNMMKILHRFIYWIQQRCSNVNHLKIIRFQLISLFFRFQLLIIILMNLYQ